MTRVRLTLAKFVRRYDGATKRFYLRLRSYRAMRNITQLSTMAAPTNIEKQ